MEPDSAALAQPEAGACWLPSHNTVTTCKRTRKTLGAILSVLYGGRGPPFGYPSKAECWLRVALATCNEDLGLSRSMATSALSRSLSSPPLLLWQYKALPPASWGFTHSFEDALNILQILETLAVHHGSHHNAYCVQHRSFWWNWNLSCKWLVHMGRGYSGHIRVGNCPHVFPLDPPQRHFLDSLLCKKAILVSLSLEIQVA